MRSPSCGWLRSAGRTGWRDSAPTGTSRSRRSSGSPRRHVARRARPEADQGLGDAEPEEVGAVVAASGQDHADDGDPVEAGEEQHLDRDVDDEQVRAGGLEPRAERRGPGAGAVVQEGSPVQVPVGRDVARVAVVVAGQPHPLAVPAVGPGQRRQAGDGDAVASQSGGEHLGTVAVPAADVVDVVADDPRGAVAGHAASSWRVSSA